MNIHHPSNRGHLLTEQCLRASSELDTLDITQTLELINDQDATVCAAVRSAIPTITQLVKSATRSLSCGGRLVYAGAGTSGRLGVLDASECPPTFFCDPQDVVGIMCGGDGALRTAVEGAEDDPAGIEPQFEELNLGQHDTFVGIAAGGTTPYVWGAIDRAKRRRATTGLICCVPIQTLADDLPKASLDVAVELLVGPEVVTGSTRMKAGTATKLALNMLSTTTMTQLGKVWGNLMIDLKISNTKLVDRAIRILEKQAGLAREDAIALLPKANGSVKRALVMAKLNCDAEEADAKLKATQGQLRPLLGPPK